MTKCFYKSSVSKVLYYLEFKNAIFYQTIKLISASMQSMQMVNRFQTFKNVQQIIFMNCKVLPKTTQQNI